MQRPALSPAQASPPLLAATQAQLPSSALLAAQAQLPSPPLLAARASPLRQLPGPESVQVQVQVQVQTMFVPRAFQLLLRD